MELVLDLSDYFYKELEEVVRVFNLTLDDMNIKDISISQYVIWVISKNIDEHKKKRTGCTL